MSVCDHHFDPDGGCEGTYDATGLCGECGRPPLNVRVADGEMDERYNAGFAEAMEYARWAKPVVIRSMGDHWNVENLDGEWLSSHETDAQAIAWVRSWIPTALEPWPADECRCVSGHHTCGKPNDADEEAAP